MHDPHIGLNYKSEYNIYHPCNDIVNTCYATLYNHSFVRRFASELSQLGFCNVSGTARGMDTAAHEVALEAGN